MLVGFDSIYRKQQYFFFSCQWPMRNSYWFCVTRRVTESAKLTSQGILHSAHSANLCSPEVNWLIILRFRVPQFITMLGIFAPIPFTLFSHNLLQQPLYFLNSFGSTLIFTSQEVRYVPKHYVLYSHAHITLCSASLLLGSQEMLFPLKR